MVKIAKNPLQDDSLSNHQNRVRSQGVLLHDLRRYFQPTFWSCLTSMLWYAEALGYLALSWFITSEIEPSTGWENAHIKAMTFLDSAVSCRHQPQFLLAFSGSTSLIIVIKTAGDKLWRYASNAATPLQLCGWSSDKFFAIVEILLSMTRTASELSIVAIACKATVVSSGQKSVSGRL